MTELSFRSGLDASGQPAVIPVVKCTGTPIKWVRHATINSGAGAETEMTLTVRVPKDDVLAEILDLKRCKD